MQEDLKPWLSPPDPSINHNTAYKTQHGGTATWFIQGNTFQDWKMNGSLLWVRGNRTLLSLFLPLYLLIDSWILQPVPERAFCGAWFLARLYHREFIFRISSAIIEDIKKMQEARPALMGYYYFDFKDASKRGVHGLLASLLFQLGDSSETCRDAVCELYTSYRNGSEQPSDAALVGCLKRMLELPGQLPKIGRAHV